MRLVAATNRDLRVAVTTRQFREDLYFRLAVLPLTIPPLRERLSDVPLLARHFLAASAADQKKPMPSLSPAALDALQAYHWPGNVRELENCLERAVILADGVIQPSHLNLTSPTAAATLAPTATPTVRRPTRRLHPSRRSPASSWMARWIRRCAACSAKSSAARSRWRSPKPAATPSAPRASSASPRASSRAAWTPTACARKKDSAVATKTAAPLRASEGAERAQKI